MEEFTQAKGNNRLFLPVSKELVAKSLFIILLIALLRTGNAKRFHDYFSRTQEFINAEIQENLDNAGKHFNNAKTTTVHISNCLPANATAGSIQKEGSPKTNVPPSHTAFYKYVKGSIVNELGIPVPNARVMVQGTGTAANTDHRGEFVLTGIQKHFTLVITCPHYETLLLSPDTNDRISVRLRYSNRKVMAELDKITIYTKTAPLILLNDHPLFRDINDIAPDDVESITMLDRTKAATITNRRAVNGVISITTKTGIYF